MTQAALQEFEAVTIKPRFECNRGGVFYIAVESDKDGQAHEKPPLRLADPIRLIGHGTDSAGNHYRVIEWRDSISRRQHTAALPMAEIGTNWGRLQRLGIAVMANRRKRELLADYLQTDGLHTPYTVTAQAGWTANRRAYVLPSGEILAAKGKAAPRVIYNGDTSQAAAYAEAGTLADWQRELGRYLAGNSRLCLAVGAALAAPLVCLLGIESGGFHLFGDSRDGKSTAARLALSVWGNPSALMVSWTGTSHGFSNLANARNDGLLVLDEIGQANPRHVSHTAYAVINGIAKIQGAKDGGNRETARWRILLLSTGEKPMDGFLQANRADWNAGQAARLPSLPSDAGKGLGIFDTLHGTAKAAIWPKPSIRPAIPATARLAAPLSACCWTIPPHWPKPAPYRLNLWPPCPNWTAKPAPWPPASQLPPPRWNWPPATASQAKAQAWPSPPSSNASILGWNATAQASMKTGKYWKMR